MSSARRHALRRVLPLVVIAAAVVVAALLTGGSTREGPPLDPASAGPDGTRALVDVLTELGVDVRVTAAPQPSDPIALLLTDHLDDDAAADLRRWVRDGGTLVVADHRSEFTPEVVDSANIGPLEASLPRSCDAAALAAVERVAVPGGVLYGEPAAGAVGCFARADGFWLVATPEGEGTVVALGGAGALTNAALGRADNGLLAAALLAPEPGGSVAFLPPATPGAGDASLADLIADRVWLALLQLGIAFAVVVAWRARRLGAPVGEPQPVQIAGSELVTAVGHLLQRTDARDQAARLLRDDLRRDLTDRLGLPVDSSAEAVAAAVARRTGRHTEGLATLLTGAAPSGEEALVALAGDLAAARRAVLADPTPTKEPVRVR